MEPYVCRNDDYVFLISQREHESLRQSPLEATLLLEGGEQTSLVARLSFVPGNSRKLTLRYEPPGAGWNSLRSVELQVNQAAYDALPFSSQGVMGTSDSDAHKILRLEISLL